MLSSYVPGCEKDYIEMMYSWYPGGRDGGMIKVWRVDDPRRLKQGMRTARTILAAEGMLKVDYGFDGFDVDAHTSSTFKTRLQNPLCCKHGVGSPFYNSEIIRTALKKDSASRLFQIIVPTNRVIIPHFRPEPSLQNSQELLVIGDIDRDNYILYTPT
jgi:hypothetical protein